MLVVSKRGEESLERFSCSVQSFFLFLFCTWLTGMLKGYAKNSSLGEALFFFYRMMCDGVRPVVGDYACLLQLCGENLDLKRGREIHGQIITNGFKSNLFAITAVMNLYAKCREIENHGKQSFDAF